MEKLKVWTVVWILLSGIVEFSHGINSGKLWVWKSVIFPI